MTAHLRVRINAVKFIDKVNKFNMNWNLTAYKIILDYSTYHTKNNAIWLIDKVNKFNITNFW